MATKICYAPNNDTDLSIILNGLNNNSTADTLQIRCVSIERITQRIGIIDPNQLDAIVEGVALCIDYK